MAYTGGLGYAGGYGGAGYSSSFPPPPDEEPEEEYKELSKFPKYQSVTSLNKLKQGSFWTSAPVILGMLEELVAEYAKKADYSKATHTADIKRLSMIWNHHLILSFPKDPSEFSTHAHDTRAILKRSLEMAVQVQHLGRSWADSGGLAVKESDGKLKVLDIMTAVHKEFLRPMVTESCWTPVLSSKVLTKQDQEAVQGFLAEGYSQYASLFKQSLLEKKLDEKDEITYIQKLIDLLKKVCPYDHERDSILPFVAPALEGLGEIVDELHRRAYDFLAAMVESKKDKLHCISRIYDWFFTLSLPGLPRNEEAKDKLIALLKSVNIGDDLVECLKHRKDPNNTETIAADEKYNCIQALLALSRESKSEQQTEALLDTIADVLLEKVKKLQKTADYEMRFKRRSALRRWAGGSPVEMPLSIARALLLRSPGLKLPKPPAPENWSKGGLKSRFYIEQTTKRFVKVVTLDSSRTHAEMLFMELVYLFRRELGLSQEDDMFMRGEGIRILEDKTSVSLCIALPLAEDIIPVTDLTMPEALGAMVDMCKAVSAFHSTGWVHNDLHIENFIYTRRNGRVAVTLCDFGLAEPVIKPPPSSGTSENTNTSNSTATEISLGRTTTETFHYLVNTREQLQHFRGGSLAHRYSCWEFDLRSLGATFLVFFSGSHVSQVVYETRDNPEHRLDNTSLFSRLRYVENPFSEEPLLSWPPEIADAIRQLMTWDDTAGKQRSLHIGDVEIRGMSVLRSVKTLLKAAVEKLPEGAHEVVVFDVTLPKKKKGAEKTKTEKHRGLETPVQVETAILKISGVTYEVELGPDGGFDSQLLGAMFGTKRLFLRDVETHAFTGVQNARPGRQYTPWASPVFDMSKYP